MAGSALIGNLAVNLSLETAAFQQGATIAEKRLEKFGAKLGKIGANIAKAGLVLTAGITAPLVAFGKQAFTAAKDAAELDAAFGETFGGMTKTMHAWAEATGNAMGRSTRELKEGMNTFGLYFNQVAKTREEAAKMSQTFTVLAQDLASFNNTDVETAIQSLRSGLSGEAEPMRKFGVFLSEAAVQAKAAEIGIAALGTKLTDQQKIAARYAIIMERTSQAQGDVARTSGSTANQIRASQAAWEELQINVGTKLLPALTPLIEALGKVLEKFNQLSPTTQTWVVGIAAVAAAIGPVMLGLGPLLMALGSLLPLVVKLAPAFGVLKVAMLALFANPWFLGAAVVIGGIYLAWKNWDKIEAIVGKMVAGVTAHLEGKLKSTLDRAKKNIEDIKSAFARMYDAVVGNSYVPDMVDGIRDHFARLRAEMVEPAMQATAQVMNAFRDIAGQAISDFGTAIADAALGTKSLADSFADMAKSIIHHLIEMTVRMLAFRAIAGLLGGVGGNSIGADLPGGGSSLYGSGYIPGMASGGGGRFGGFSGVDKNVLALNGSPIARVSKGESWQVSPENRRSSGDVKIEQHYNFSGVAVTKQEFVQGLMFAKHDTIATIKDMNRR